MASDLVVVDLVGGKKGSSYGLMVLNAADLHLTRPGSMPRCADGIDWMRVILLTNPGFCKAHSNWSAS